MLIYPNKNQRGEAAMVIIAIVAVAIIGAAIWYGVSRNHKTVATTPAQKATQSTCMKLYNDNVICNFAVTATNFQNSSYTATATSTSNGATSHLTIKNDGKGNTDISTVADGQTVSVVNLGNNYYVQEQAGGSWIEYPSTSNPAADTTTNPASDIKFNFAGGSLASTFHKVKTEACGSLTCVEYAVTDPANPGSTFSVWIDTTNYRLQRWQATESSGTVDMTFVYGPITISTPSPVTSL